MPDFRVEVTEAQVERDVATERLTAENERLSRLLGLVDSYHSGAGTPPLWARAKKKYRPATAIAGLHLSDLHLDEVCDPGELAGLNAYNRDIAGLRLRRWADKACEMGERYPHAWSHATVFWGGDMVSGAIHDELRESNADTLPGTMVHWAPLLAAAIRQVADFYGKVYVPAVVGNHGRLTVKKQSKKRQRNSWDWLLCQMVASHFQDDDRVVFDIAATPFLFVPMFDDHAYLTHGDEVNGGSGWAGVWSPLQTATRKGGEMANSVNRSRRSNEIRMAYSVIGHFHQCVLAYQRGLSCNGAMKGWDEYAADKKFTPERAQQNWFVHTPEHGVTLAAPLILEDRKSEGW